MKTCDWLCLIGLVAWWLSPAYYIMQPNVPCILFSLTSIAITCLDIEYWILSVLRWVPFMTLLTLQALLFSRHRSYKQSLNMCDAWWNHLSMHRGSLRMDKWLHLTLYKDDDYLSMLALVFFHVGKKRGVLFLIRFIFNPNMERLSNTQ